MNTKPGGFIETSLAYSAMPTSDKKLYTKISLCCTKRKDTRIPILVLLAGAGSNHIVVQTEVVEFTKDIVHVRGRCGPKFPLPSGAPSKCPHRYSSDLTGICTCVLTVIIVASQVDL